MIRKMKNIAAAALFVLSVFGTCGCADINVNVDVREAENPESPKEIREETYKKAYLDKIEELLSAGLADQFAFTYIDGDEIPELIASDSEGSFDHENAFIFTAAKDEAVKLAGVIAGVDGACLDFSEGKNIIHISGAAEGMRDVFSKIADGTLEEAFSAEAVGEDEDAEYSVNGKRVTEDEYYAELAGFTETCAGLKRISYDGLYEVSYKLEDGYGYFEQGSFDKYSTPEEIAEKLK
ncbi:MAG: hypothetical protein K6G58_07985 [Lachnospiraceae bacterium]|nr:hypothetical protein [Lachnospiraceae bacterium]